MSRERRLVLLVTGVLCAAVLLFAGRDLDTPGLYYDEVIQATPASEFLRDGGEPLRIPGARNTRLFGGWFPLMTQPYMGALKSQLLIPVFAAFGATPETLRRTTLVWGCLGLLLVTLWIHETYGAGAALASALLLASDPSFVFVSRHDWGSVALALILRGGGLWLATTGWRRGSQGRLAAAGLLLGLGVYNKVDFAPFLAACGAALLVAAPRATLAALRQQPGRVAVFAAGLLVGAAPMILGLGGVLSATEGMLRSTGVRPDDLGEKLLAWRTLLDGSYFHRLMLAGGRFEELGSVEGAASGPFLWIFVACYAGLVVRAVVGLRRGEPDRPLVFALAATAFTVLLLLATPRAARIHHVMNVEPLPQLVVALAAVQLGRRGPALRAVGALVVAVAALGSARIDAAVLDTLRETGGRGRWSNALEELATKLPADAVVVSLDWGFHAPLRFVRPDLELVEPVWRLYGRAGTLRGGPKNLYLVWEPENRVFDLGSRLLDAVAKLPPESVEVRVYTDRLGEPAFRSVRFAHPHDLVYRGDVEVRWR